MTLSAGWAGIAMGLLFAGCSAQSEQDAVTKKIAQSVRVGAAAADSRPGYGFDLYPGAQVTGSILDGMSLSIRSDDGFDRIVAFYEAQLIEKGWQIESRELKEGKMTLQGVMPANQRDMMNITVAQAERSGHYNLIFLKITQGE